MKLADQIGHARAMDLLLTGRLISGAEAERIGLVSACRPAAELWDTALASARAVAATSRVAARATKRAVALGHLARYETGISRARHRCRGPAKRRPRAGQGCLSGQAPAGVRRPAAAPGRGTAMSMREAATRRGPAAGEAPRKLTRAEKSQKIKRDLLAAAAKVVGKVGYSNAQVSRITALANVGQGTFYNHFASRQDLFDQLLPTLGARSSTSSG